MSSTAEVASIGSSSCPIASTDFIDVPFRRFACDDPLQPVSLPTVPKPKEGVEAEAQGSWVLAGQELLDRGVTQGVEKIVEGIWGLNLATQGTVLSKHRARHRASFDHTTAPTRKTTTITGASPATGFGVGVGVGILASRSTGTEASGVALGARVKPSIEERLAAAASSLAGRRDAPGDAQWQDRGKPGATWNPGMPGLGTSVTCQNVATCRHGEEPCDDTSVSRKRQATGKTSGLPSGLVPLTGSSCSSEYLRAGFSLHGQADLPRGRDSSALARDAFRNAVAAELMGARGHCSTEGPTALSISRAPFRFGASECLEHEVAVVRKRLIRLAGAVHRRDMIEVQSILPTLQPFSDRRGTPLQRAVHVSLQTLMLRFAGRGSAHMQKPPDWKPKDMSKALLWMMRSLPVPAFVGVAMTGMTLHRLMGQNSIHIIDMGQSMLPQWPYFIKLLASQPGRPLQHLRITWLDSSLLVNPWTSQMTGLDKGVEVSQGIRAAAEAAGIGISFEHVALCKDSMHMLYDIRRRQQDTLVFTITMDLMFYPVETHQQLAEWMRMLDPDSLAIVELDLATTSMGFVAQFKALFDYHYNCFRMHDACTQPKDMAQRNLLEEVYNARMMTRVISCEGQECVCQPAGPKAWTEQFVLARFQQEKLSSSMLDAAYEVIKRFPSGFGLTLVEERLTLTWQDSPVAFAFSWTTS